MAIDNQEHGTINTYNCGCRCELCKEANRAYQRDWRKKKRAEHRVEKELVQND